MIDALHEVTDPEVGIDIVDLGLIHGIEVTGDTVRVSLTMTTAACPLGEQILEEVEATVLARVPGVRKVVTALVWDPPWTSERMSASARRQLGWSD